MNKKCVIYTCQISPTDACKVLKYVFKYQKRITCCINHKYDTVTVSGLSMSHLQDIMLYHLSEYTYLTAMLKFAYKSQSLIRFKCLIVLLHVVQIVKYHYKVRFMG